ncbi:hypothetical protein QBC46DRAFT_412237 [Diplogelasinospora grovesii]|uniref:Uncharacterized protein n=1 Tax=Diplogelasinospora grovesii TaxID=303347 RepID=A0AAN6S0V4_9PEZI|nr:hypothetical protein QBC46DRAFT_412237 [Diplogelasinospora grovesii]
MTRKAPRSKPSLRVAITPRLPTPPPPSSPFPPPFPNLQTPTNLPPDIRAELRACRSWPTIHIEADCTDSWTWLHKRMRKAFARWSNEIKLVILLNVARGKISIQVWELSHSATKRTTRSKTAKAGVIVGGEPQMVQMVDILRPVVPDTSPKKEDETREDACQVIPQTGIHLKYGDVFISHLFRKPTSPQPGTDVYFGQSFLRVLAADLWMSLSTCKDPADCRRRLNEKCRAAIKPNRVCNYAR